MALTSLIIKINGKTETSHLDSKIDMMKRNKWKRCPLISISDGINTLELELKND